MAISEIYVDPSIAADSGAGTIGDPYGDVEWAVKQADLPAGGARVNIKAGTDEILVAALQTALADVTEAGKSSAWVPTRTAPLIFQGYTATAGDGGVGGISGGGSVGIMTDAVLDYVSFLDLHLHNTGAVQVLNLDNDCTVSRCEINNSSLGGVFVDNSSIISDCYIHDIAGPGVGVGGDNCQIKRNLFENGSKIFTYTINLNVVAANVYRNIFKLDQSSNGMSIGVHECSVNHNSFWSDGGTGTAIELATNILASEITNNVFDGFSGTGGVAIDLSASGTAVQKFGANSIYNCTTGIATGAIIYDDIGGDETLSASPFTDPSNGDFSPVDTGSVKEGSIPSTIANQ